MWHAECIDERHATEDRNLMQREDILSSALITSTVATDNGVHINSTVLADDSFTSEQSINGETLIIVAESRDGGGDESSRCFARSVKHLVRVNVIAVESGGHEFESLSTLMRNHVTGVLMDKLPENIRNTSRDELKHFVRRNGPSSIRLLIDFQDIIEVSM